MSRLAVSIPESRQAFHETLDDLAGRGTAIILSSHVLTEVEAGTDRIAIMREGRLAALGTADELKRRAGLAVTIRVAVRPGGGARLASALAGRSSERINDHAVELRCDAGEKRALIERILGLGDEVEDIEIVPPGLDAVYARFRRQRRRREGARAVTAVATIAGREVLAGIRNRWMLAAALAPRRAGADARLRGQRRRAGPVAASRLAITVVSLSSLSVFLVPLIGLLVSYDTLVGEIERGSMPLLMTHPVTRLRIVLGKFAGQVAILAIATVVGFGVAALATGLGDGGDAEAWRAFGVMVGSSILLGAAFIALGTLISAVVAERGTAAGISAAVWLVFVVLFDMALLAVLVADEGQVISGDLFRVLLLLNPTDVYRMLTLAGSETVGALSGMAGVSAEAAFGHALLFPVMVLWIAVPLGLAGLLFGRKEL